MLDYAKRVAQVATSVARTLPSVIRVAAQQGGPVSLYFEMTTRKNLGLIAALAVVKTAILIGFAAASDT